MVIFAILLIFVLFIVVNSIKVIPESKQYVIERLGKYDRTLGSGLNFIVPIIDKVYRKVSLKEQVADFPPQGVITKDNVAMKIDTVVYFHIQNPKLFAYGAENPILALENLTATTLRNIVGELELDQTLTSRDTINNKMQGILDAATDPWGIKVNRVELKNIIPPKQIQESMEKQMKAERDRRETLLEAEGHKQAAITRAEGDKQALVLKAEAERDAKIARAKGEAESIRLLYEAKASGLNMLTKAKVDKATMLMLKLDSLEKLADGRSTKIVIPTDLVKEASDMTFTSEMLGIGHAEPIDKSDNTVPNEKLADECCEKENRSETTKEFLLNE